MTDPGAVPPSNVPSSTRLLRSTLIALGVAGVILMTIVLPAEYGVDPTGIGKVLGLKDMGDIKMQLAREAAALDDSVSSAPDSTTAATPTAATAPGMKSDSIAFRLAPNQGHEIKLVMRKDAQVNFAWRTSRNAVNYDLHADAPGISYHGYAKGTSVPADSGVLTAAFDGSHGWFWRNRSADTVTVTLRTSGSYQELKRSP